nr:hypothetical protein [uncultured organism]
MKTQKTKTTIELGATVEWTWMGRPVKGTVKRIFLKPVTKVLREHTYTRNGSPEKPAYLIKSEAGSEVLKSVTEIRKING